jgi:hypothetical protein
MARLEKLAEADRLRAELAPPFEFTRIDADQSSK